MRIVSLLPSATEIVASLGMADLLVGRSAECDWPDEVRELPVVTAARVDTAAMNGAEIDAAVRAALLEGGSLYAIDERVLSELEPDLIITQDLCRVCAVSGDDVARLQSIEAEVISLDPHTIGEIEGTVRLLADRLDTCRAGSCERGADVVTAMRRTIIAAMDAVAGKPQRPVFVAEWLDPPFAAGHWVPETVDLAGGRDVLGMAGRASYATTWPVVAAARPEVVVAAPCGYDRERAAAEATAVESKMPAPWVAVDANAHFSRPSPRIAEGVRLLADILHGESAEAANGTAAAPLA
ncbi:MAG TPA: ABC transporter substrate-binding protein [Gaiellales bacterium]|nr:ABC transporter substrate-binding protein [Gaiellales bacterium]